MLALALVAGTSVNVSANCEARDVPLLPPPLPPPPL